jgi:hypothetical protein
MKGLQAVMRDVARKFGYTVLRSKEGKGRYAYAVLQKRKQQFFMKAAWNRHPDYDEPRMLYNLQREVWWALLVKALHQRRCLPFDSPQVKQTNIKFKDQENEEVGWIIFSLEQATPLGENRAWWQKKRGKKILFSRRKWIQRCVPPICRTLAALQKITPSTVKSLPLPSTPPHVPHKESRVPRSFLRLIERKRLLGKDMLGQAEKVLRNSPRICRELGQGDFELSHLILREDGTLVITDNEFAGWYPKYDSLTYLLHRLWASRRKPDLARVILGYFVRNFVPRKEREKFWEQFWALFIPRVLRGFYYDLTRRGFGASHPNQKRRRELLTFLLRGDLEELMS